MEKETEKKKSTAQIKREKNMALYLAREAENATSKKNFQKYSYTFLFYSILNFIVYLLYDHNDRPEQISLEIWNTLIPIIIILILAVQSVNVFFATRYCLRTDNDGEGWRIGTLLLAVMNIFTGGYLGLNAGSVIYNLILN